jgi:hypothetical protein
MEGKRMSDLFIAVVVVVLGGLTWGLLDLADWLLGGEK